MAKEIKIENKHVYLAFAAGLLYYLAYYLKFPNSYSAAISFILITLLIRHFKKIEGLKMIILSLIISLMTAAAVSLAGNLNWIYVLVMISFNIIVLLLMIFSLKALKKWGMYFSLVIFIISLISSFIGIISFDQAYFDNSLQSWIINIQSAASISFSLLSIIFLVKFRKSFK